MEEIIECYDARNHEFYCLGQLVDGGTMDTKEFEVDTARAQEEEDEKTKKRIKDMEDFA